MKKILVSAFIFVLTVFSYSSASAIVEPNNEEPVSVYRFWSPVFHSHFYTISESEAMNVKNYDSNWIYEGEAFMAYENEVEGTVPVYRFWSDKFHKHFYTANEDEFYRLVSSDPNWRFERIDFYAYPKNYNGSFHDVYRFWSPNFDNAHFYTADTTEMNNTIQDPNWDLEDIAFRVPYIIY